MRFRPSRAGRTIVRLTTDVCARLFEIRLGSTALVSASASRGQPARRTAVSSPRSGHRFRRPGESRGPFCRSPSFKRGRRKPNWIPAFAGMTATDDGNKCGVQRRNRGSRFPRRRQACDASHVACHASWWPGSAWDDGFASDEGMRRSTVAAIAGRLPKKKRRPENGRLGSAVGLCCLRCFQSGTLNRSCRASRPIVALAAVGSTPAVRA
jgi:hypothetical protein